MNKSFLRGAIVVLSFLGLTGFATSLNNTIHVPNNTALKALSTKVGSMVVRDGYTALGDAPPLAYKASASTCSLASGNGDDASQVRSADGKCWIAAFSFPLDTRWFGQSTIVTHVATTGADVGYCTTALPCRTGQYAVGIVGLFSANGQNALVSYACGLYNTVADSTTIGGGLNGAVAGSTSGSEIIFQGCDNAGGTYINPPGITFQVSGPGTSVAWSNMKLASTGNDVLFLQNTSSSSFWDSGVIFGPAPLGQHFHLESMSRFELPGAVTYKICGSAASHVAGSENIHYEYDPGFRAITFCPGTYSFPNGFAIGQRYGMIGVGQGLTFNTTGATFTTTPAYTITGNFLIDLLGVSPASSLTFFPSDGTTKPVAWTGAPTGWLQR
jgi:hypothetical protein